MAHALGMAAVYGIVKNHGGWIAIDSSPGLGTTVRTYFPTDEPMAGTIRWMGTARFEAAVKTRHRTVVALPAAKGMVRFISDRH